MNEKPTRPPQICYLMQHDGPGLLVKIGVTSDVKRRAAQLSAGMPFNIRLLAIIGGGATTEREFKAQFRHVRVKGEWFRPEPAINAWLAAKHESERLLRQVPTDRAFIAERLAPLARAYLAGRDPANNGAGDLVSRLLSGDLPDSAPRAASLVLATKGAISMEVAHGYVPDSSLAAFVPVQLPPMHAVTSEHGAVA